MYMKYLVTAALLVSMSAMAAEEPAKVVEPAKAETTATCPVPYIPTLNELWNETEGNEFKQALVNGTPTAEILMGYEYSDFDDNGTDAADAFLTRFRLSYLTDDYRGFSAFAQLQYVWPLNDHYRPRNADYDIVADPEKARWQQLYLAYKGYDTVARVGSQEIILDNARFIGNVGWRLNAQSFNAGSFKNNSISNLTLYYAYSDSINQTDGTFNDDREYHLLNAEYKLSDNNKVSSFAYLQENDDTSDIDTFGVRAWGKNDNISHDLMIAFQRDAYYGSAFGEVNLDGINIGGGVEYISGGNDHDERFQTLNGTAHKFNGWADQFLGTGGGATGVGLNGGLVDGYIQVSGKAYENLTLKAVYHYFYTADETNPDASPATGVGGDGGFKGEYGQEIDLLAKYPVCSNFNVLAKFAYYVKGDNDTDNFTEDETVFWLRGTLTF
jgi:hypothetical protein